MAEGCKICNVCNIEKPLSEFYYRKEQDRYRPNCKKCKPLRSKEMIMAQARANKKVCKHCNIEKLASEYQKAGGGKWLQPYCKLCDAERKRRYNIENTDKIKVKHKKYYESNKGKIAKKSKEFYNSNKDVIAIRSKAYREKTKERKSIKDRLYREKNKEKLLKQKKEYYLKNKDILSEKARIYRNDPDVKAKKKITDKLYREKNKDKINATKEKRKDITREKARIRSNEKSKTDISYRILKNLRSRIRFALKKGQIKKADTTENLLGCTVPEFKAYFTSLFTNDMSWNDFMAGKIHIDHIIPCAKFDLTNEEEQRICFHYTNLQPLWSTDNLKKGTKIIANIKINA
jgi:hypothetical protein